MNLPFAESPQQRKALAIALIVLASVILIALLKTPGFIIAMILAGAAWLMVSARPDASEHKALRSSIRLSADDIADVLNQFDEFANGSDTDAVADRTLHRPALLDRDCVDPAVERFHYQQAASQRFLRRLDARINDAAMDIAELENLLKVTDQRAAELQEAWIEARRSAFRLGPNYKDHRGELEP